MAEACDLKTGRIDVGVLFVRPIQVTVTLVIRTGFVIFGRFLPRGDGQDGEAKPQKRWPKALANLPVTSDRMKSTWKS